MWIIVSGPYRKGSTEPAAWAANLRRLNAAAYEIFRQGHVPVIGVNMALPVIDAAGSGEYDELMMPLSLSLTERCDADLRIGGHSLGADGEVARFHERNLPVFHSMDEISATSSRLL
jgi:hypothetical protein